VKSIALPIRNLVSNATQQQQQHNDALTLQPHLLTTVIITIIHILGLAASDPAIFAQHDRDRMYQLMLRRVIAVAH
jgi:hypothetical protein